MHARTNHGENMWVLVIVKDTDGRDNIVHQHL